MTPKEVCNTLADKYESGEITWIQGYRGKDKTCCCILFGLGFVTGQSSLFYEAKDLVRALIPDEYHGIASWNDMEGRTLEQVLFLLRRAGK